MGEHISKIIGDENELRDRLSNMIQKEPYSIREYTRRIFPINRVGGPNKSGHGVLLRKFLDGKGKFTDLTLLKIKCFLDNNEK
jgi:hypothetical protein